MAIPDNNKQKKISSIVRSILAEVAKDAGADVSRYEREIDENVYAIYGLTADEIKQVETSVKNEKKETKK